MKKLASNVKKVLVVGTDLAGLVTAIAFNQKGIRVDILDTTHKQSGKALILPTNALVELSNSGYDILQRSIGAVQLSRWMRTDEYGSVFGVVDYLQQRIYQPFSILGLEKSLVLSDLGLLLQSHRVPIHKGVTLTGITQIRNPDQNINLPLSVKCTFETRLGRSGLNYSGAPKFDREYDLVIGADGLNSTVRKIETRFKPHALFPHFVRWETIIDKWQDFNSDIIEMWGGGKRFGFFAVDYDKLYVWGTHGLDRPVEQLKLGACSAHQMLRSGGYSIFKNSLSRLIFERFSRGEVSCTLDLGIQSENIGWLMRGRVVLVGEAAFSVLPITNGQDIATEIFSATALVDSLATYEDLSVALGQYQKYMMDNFSLLQAYTSKLSQMAHSNPTNKALWRLLMKWSWSSSKRMIRQENAIIKHPLSNLIGV